METRVRVREAGCYGDGMQRAGRTTTPEPVPVR